MIEFKPGMRVVCDTGEMGTIEGLVDVDPSLYTGEDRLWWVIWDEIENSHDEKEHNVRLHICEKYMAPYYDNIAASIEIRDAIQLLEYNGIKVVIPSDRLPQN